MGGGMMSVSGGSKGIDAGYHAEFSNVFGIRVSHATLYDVVGMLANRGIDLNSKPRLILTVNVDHIVNLRRSERFRAAYDNALLITMDGFPVFLYARMRGLRVPERVTGADLVPELLDRLDPHRHRLFFVASAQETADGIRDRLYQRGFTDASLQIWIPPLGFEMDEAYQDRLLDALSIHATTHLFMGVGSPKSEVWASENLERLGGCDVLCVGAALDFYAGTRRRAPMLMRTVGLEWFWRFMQEPRRLFGRYFIRSWGFVAAIADDLRGRSQ
jgi:N-acetylglucosaminyldiphosphoundecaprenol N-acetyl-beta-D-mannosaminyltransferase